MTAPLSTSNSSADFFDDKPWTLAIIGSLFIVTVAVLFFEYNLRSRHWTPTVSDSPELWAQERDRASALGKEALILIGGSRIQLGVDLDVLEKHAGKKPVQLAIDGSNFYPVLKNLAEDPHITGDVILDLNEFLIQNLYLHDKGWDWVAAYEQRQQQPLYQQVDQRIHNALTSTMITKMEGAKPSKVINDLVFHPKKNTGNYLITHGNRSRDADYSKVKMPDFYISRVIRHSLLNLSTEAATTYQQVLDIYEAAIPQIQQGDQTAFEENLLKMLALIKMIEQRGSQVIIVRMPTSKLVWKIDQQRFPAELFWQKIISQHPTSIHGVLEPSLGSFDLPDGSHLDQKDKAAFTEQLYQVIAKHGNTRI
jgi:hypothetical protein